MIKDSIIAKLTSKDDKYACTFADKIILESKDTDEWDEDNHFDAILDDYLAHVTDEKPITARQCIKALAQVGKAKPQYIQKIMDYLHSADLSKYKDSMHPLIEKDMAGTEKALTLYENVE